MRVDLNEKQKIPIHSYQHDKIKMDQLYKNVELKIYTYSENGMFGEENLLKNQNRSFSVLCESFIGELLVIQASEFFNKVMKFSPEVIQTIQKHKESIYGQSFDLQKKNMDKYSNFILENRCEAMNQIELQHIQKQNGQIRDDHFQQIDLQYRINKEFHQLKNIDPNISPQLYKMKDKKRNHSFYRRKMYQQLLTKQKSVENPICSLSTNQDSQMQDAPDVISSLINKKKEVFQEKNMKHNHPEQYDDIIEISPRTKKMFQKRQSASKSPQIRKSGGYQKRSSVQVLENLIKNASKNYQVNDSFFKKEDDNKENKSNDAQPELSVSLERIRERTLSVDATSMKNIEKLLKRRDSIATRLVSQHSDTSNSQLLDDLTYQQRSKDLREYQSTDFIKYKKSRDYPLHLPKIEQQKSALDQSIQSIKHQIDQHNNRYQNKDSVLQQYLDNRDIRSSSEHNYAKLQLSQFIDPLQYKQMCNQNVQSRYLQSNQKKVNIQRAVWQYNMQQMNKSKLVINQALNNIKIQNEQNNLSKSIPVRICSSLASYSKINNKIY